MSDQQKLIDMMFSVAFASAEHMHGKFVADIAEWVATQLRECGFDTKPCGSSWGVLVANDEPADEPEQLPWSEFLAGIRQRRKESKPA